MKGYWLVTRDRPGLVAAILPLLAGEARLVLEGDLKRCRLPHGVPTSGDARRLTVPLAPELVRPILDAIAPGPLERDIVQVRVEHRDETLFESRLDDPVRGTFVTSNGVSEDFLFRLQVLGIIRSWMGPTEGP